MKLAPAPEIGLWPHFCSLNYDAQEHFLTILKNSKLSTYHVYKHLLDKDDSLMNLLYVKIKKNVYFISYNFIIYIIFLLVAGLVYTAG